MTEERWHDVCALEDLIEGGGVAALAGGRQGALFRVHGRIYALDNFDNLQASWVTMGLKIGQVSLRFGCNDFGSLMIEENVVSAAGTTYRLAERDNRLAERVNHG